MTMNLSQLATNVKRLWEQGTFVVTCLWNEIYLFTHKSADLWCKKMPLFPFCIIQKEKSSYCISSTVGTRFWELNNELDYCMCSHILNIELTSGHVCYNHYLVLETVSKKLGKGYYVVHLNWCLFNCKVLEWSTDVYHVQ